MHLRYNAPVTFSFALICTVVLLIDQYVAPGFVATYLRAPGADFQASQPQNWFALIFYVFGHENWTHLWNNLLFLILLGPILEEKYAPKAMLFMMTATTLVAGIFNVLLRQPPLVGSSAIVFMMIMLVSFARTKQGEIPVSFLLVFILFMLAEITRGAAPGSHDVSSVAHVVGGVCGTIFGFLKMAAGQGGAPAPGGPPKS
ncbi:MAG: rhomboid family intramembrane serine protease [Spirochaetales bacterium]|nr:rhomboid family intramembrane serine protease [Spirochaetales bacterium]